MDERLRLVIEGNVALQRRARELNIRAGEEAFSIMNQSEWNQWLVTRLNGARKASEIINMETLRLPELDQEMIDMIMTDNPDTIEVLGQDFPVAYRNSGYAPQIILEGELVEDNRWNDLSEAGIKLPGGRLVEVKVVTSTGRSGTSYADTNIPALKEKVRNHFNQKVWEGWSKPEIVIPDLVADGAIIPEIETREYGQCVVTSFPLVAYGTLIAYRYWSNDPITWKYEWYRERKTAEENRDKAVEALTQYQSAERKKQALDAIVIPDPSQEDAVIPEIAEIEGGYGVVIVNSSRYYSSDPYFKIYWTEDQDDAMTYRERAAEKLNEIKSEEVSKREISEAKTEAEVVKDKIRQAYNHHDKDKLDSGLRDKLYDFYYGNIPSDLNEIRQWTANAQNACIKAEEGFAKIERKRAERREMGIKIPDSLIRAYNGDEDKAYEFMQKVAALRTRSLDKHVVCNCGRDRVYHHLTQVSGDDDFFMGADPNDVKYYVGEVHYYGKDYGVPVVNDVEVIPEGERKAPTDDAMAALLAKFGRN